MTHRLGGSDSRRPRSAIPPRTEQRMTACVKQTAFGLRLDPPAHDETARLPASAAADAFMAQGARPDVVAAIAPTAALSTR